MLPFSSLKSVVCTLFLKCSPVRIEYRCAKWMAGLLASATVEALNWNVLYLSVWQTVFQAETGYSDCYTKKQRSQCCARQIEQWAPAAAEGKECIENWWQSSLRSIMFTTSRESCSSSQMRPTALLPAFWKGITILSVWVGWGFLGKLMTCGPTAPLAVRVSLKGELLSFWEVWECGVT